MKKFLAVFGKPRFLGILTTPESINIDKLAPIIVESQRGTEVAMLVAPLTQEQETVYRKIRTASENNEGAVRGGELAVTDLEFVAIADENAASMQEELRAEEEGILRRSKELLLPHNLDMKLIDVELFWDRKKLFFYFTSEQRVDFRAFVRDLAREFKTRIELRQVGVRDEAKIISGLASCGRECCCSYWLNQFSPICIRMVKEQNLALNPTKISGICGRLMCCMCFEHNSYKELWEHLPNPGSKFATPSGNVILLGVHLSKRAARCLVPGAGEKLVPVERFQEFKEVMLAGGQWDVEVEEHTGGCAGCSSKGGCSGCSSKGASHVQKLPHKNQESSLTFKGNESTTTKKQPVTSKIFQHEAGKAEEFSGTSEETHAKKSRSRRRRAPGKNPPQSRKQSADFAEIAGQITTGSVQAVKKKKRRPRRKPQGETDAKKSDTQK